ncbi:MAG: alpha/beta fold hydrolase [Nitriliruptorales bacterium]|nr:alpha/beta fold hydrolase [Nitriliruptorales bacterium]
MERPAWFDESQFPFASRFVEVDGARVHHVDEGEGPVLLMLHGQSAWSFLFRHLIRELRDEFRCVAIDYPGFGLSEAPPGYGFRVHEHVAVIERVVQELGLSGITPVVSNWGGPIGMAVSVRQPELVRAFVIGNTWAWPENATRPKILSRLLGGPVGDQLVRRLGLFSKAMSRMMQPQLTDAERAMYRGPHPTPRSREPVQVFLRELVDARPLLEAVEQGLEGVADRPALIVWGERDPRFGADERRRFEQTFPDHETVVLDRAGHYLWEDAPGEIANAIRQWSPGVTGA